MGKQTPGFGSRRALLAAATGVAFAAGAAEADDGAWGTDEERACLPEVFVGTVVRRLGVANVATRDSGPWLVPLYAVKVERALKGSADGLVLLTFDDSPFADPAVGTLRVGGRYLFAGVGPDDWVASCTAQAGMGNVPIADPDDEARRVAGLERLIAKGRCGSATPVAATPAALSG